MAPATEEKIKSFWFPILISIIGFGLSSGVFMMVDTFKGVSHEVSLEIKKMTDSISSIDKRLGIMGEKYSNIDKDVQENHRLLQRAGMEAQQYLIRLINAENEIKRINYENSLRKK